ncbi:heavy metal response regulator transcription factor [Oligella ureolytica]
MPSAIRILIVEDHPALVSNLVEFFEPPRYILDFAIDGQKAYELVKQNDYDVLLLDVMLPGINGFQLCQRIRQELNKITPILFMTAKDQIIDKTQGFEVGGDDYIVKPFNLKELQLRVEALYRRQYGFKQSAVLQAAGFSYDQSNQQVAREGLRFTLAGISADIMQCLMRAYPETVSHNDLIAHVWGDKEVDMNTIRTQVYILRKQLLDNFAYGAIKTIHAKGYRLLSIDEAE